jgi:hypothetical protein
MGDGYSLCYGTMAFLIIVPTTVIWLLTRRSGASLFNHVPTKVKQFERKNPELQLITAGATKARMMKSDRKTRPGLGWAMARRSVLFLSEDGLHCGNWFIPLSTITEATLIKTPTGAILKVSTIDDHFYQFGLRSNPAWEEQTTIQIKVEYSDLILSTTTIIIRLAIVGYCLYLVTRDIAQHGFSIFTVLLIAVASYFLIYYLLPIIRFIKSKVEMKR